VRFPPREGAGQNASGQDGCTFMQIGYEAGRWPAAAKRDDEPRPSARAGMRQAVGLKQGGPPFKPTFEGHCIYVVIIRKVLQS
jgi:hypothetical protein